MDSLLIELYCYHTLVFGKVVYQDESLRAGCSGSKVLHRNAGFKIMSHITPTLSRDVLCIRGRDCGSDNSIFQYRCMTEEEAQGLCRKIRNAINCVNHREYENTCSTGIRKIL